MPGYLPKPSFITEVNSHPLTNGLVLAVPLNEGSAGGGVKDFSGYGNDGVVNGVPSVEGGSYGWSWRFDENLSNYISIDDFVLDTSKPWTLSIVMKQESFGEALFAGPCLLKTDQTEGFTIASSDTNPAYQKILFGNDDNFVNMHVPTITNAEFIGVSCRVIIKYVGGGISTIGNYKFFLNGVEHAIQSAGAFGPTDNRTAIGQGSAASNIFDGLINGIHVWDRELSEAEVSLINQDPYIMYRRPTALDWIGGSIVTPVSGTIIPKIINQTRRRRAA